MRVRTSAWRICCASGCPANHPLREEATRRQWATQNLQTYLRLAPELRAKTAGPHIPGEPAPVGARHPILKGFDATDILPYGGSLGELRVDTPADVLMTFVPPLPAFPPESVWSSQTKTSLPGLVVHERPEGGRVAYLAADLDRRYARDNISDIGNLLANLVRWAAKDDIPIAIDGPGLLDCHLYRQSSRVILHLVNLTNEGTWRGPIDELIPIGPVRVRVRLPDDLRARRLGLLVSAQKPALKVADGWVSFELDSILDHEVAVIEG